MAAALILYPEDDRAHRLFEEIDAFGTDFLPPRSERAVVVRDEALSDEALRRFVGGW